VATSPNRRFRTRALALGVAALGLVAAGTVAGAVCAGERDGVRTPHRDDRGVMLVFAASDGAGDACMKADNAGCDLYLARYDLDAREVRSVERLTDTPGEAEWFPAVDPTGSFVLYESRVDRRGQITLLDLDHDTAEVLFPGRYPDFDHQGERFAYSTRQRALVVVPYGVDRSGLQPGAPQEVGAGRDPQFLPDGETLIFHYQPRGETTRTALQGLPGGLPVDFSDADRCAHASVSPDGTVGTCGVGGSVRARRFEDGEWGVLDSLAVPRRPPEYGPRFEDCRRVSYGYAEFCGDGEHLVVTAHCGVDGEPTFANLLLIDLTTGEIIDLHDQLEQARGVSGTHSATVSCRAP